MPLRCLAAQYFDDTPNRFCGYSRRAFDAAKTTKNKNGIAAFFYVQYGQQRYDTMRRVRHNAGMAHCKGNGEPQRYSKHGVPIAMSEVR